MEDRDDHFIVKDGFFDGIAEDFEILARYPCVFDLGQAAFVGIGIEKLAGLDIFGGSLAPQVLGFGVDAVEEGGGDFALNVEVGLFQVLGQNGRGGTVPLT